MERAIDRIFMTLLISVDPFLHRRIAENEVGVAHVEMGDLPMVGRKPEFAKSFACSFALVVSGIKRIQVTGGQKNALAERGELQLLKPRTQLSESSAMKPVRNRD